MKFRNTFRGVCVPCNGVRPECVTGMLARNKIKVCVRCVRKLIGFTPDPQHRARAPR